MRVPVTKSMNTKMNLNFSVTDQEIKYWITREVPHMSDMKNRRDYYAKWWNVAHKIKIAKSRGEY